MYFGMGLNSVLLPSGTVTLEAFVFDGCVC